MGDGGARNVEKIVEKRFAKIGVAEEKNGGVRASGSLRNIAMGG